MAPSQRPATRFFAAFYRWNCHAHRTRCIYSAARHPRHQYAPPRIAAHQKLRPYTPTRAFGQSPTREETLGEEHGLRKGTEAQEEATVQPKELEESWLDTVPDEDAVEYDVRHHVRTGALRSLMRRVPSSVVIITAAATDPETNMPIPLGTALSSFNTVSLDPPYVSFNIKYPSQTLDAIRANASFRAHFLDDGLRSAQIVDTFTRGNNPDTFKQRRLRTQFIQFSPRQGLKLKSTHVIATLQCELSQEVTVADHVIVVAKVATLESTSTANSTIIYHDGIYKRNNGTRLPVTKPDAQAIRNTNIYWEYPLLLGETERQDFVERLKTHIFTNRKYLNMDVALAINTLRADLDIPTGTLGVNLYALLHECKEQVSGNTDRGNTRQVPVLSDFWGHCGPRDIASIVERARKFVQSDPLVLNLHWRAFYEYIGIDPRSSNVLASDILEPLRAEHLVGPNDMITRPNIVGIDNGGRDSTLEVLEFVETRLREILKSVNYETAIQLRYQELVQDIGRDEGWAFAYLNRIRPRVLCEVFPEVFSEKFVDIRGEVSPEEARVALARIVHAMIFANPSTAYYKLSKPKSETLRSLGIHPMVSGIDTDFIFGKLTHILYSTASHNALLSAVDEAVKPYFYTHTIYWDDLISRARGLVQKHTLQVVHWSREDLLAAMGIDHRTKVRTPLSSNRPHLLYGHMLPTIFAKELKAQYGKGTPEENEAIATFLQTNFSYKIQNNTSSHTSIPPLSQSQSPSDDMISEMHGAMMQNLNIHVRKGDVARQEIEEAMRDFGTYRESERNRRVKGAAKKKPSKMRQERPTTRSHGFVDKETGMIVNESGLKDNEVIGTKVNEESGIIYRYSEQAFFADHEDESKGDGAEADGKNGGPGR
ncbi:hypothetical protein P280DRAFT_549034 [Massarina eburnea CBS 473.64]|uniref:Flavin reductase like domain-containing protein n=1 Tax=Massarina eburnea CBS 473.64 TaxID=1395130 RepID=A0A6A6S0D9_9PLEO|nr:hypothetical protein P280DRAFT_549034 [Massarina eburnea CBS 473.64]